MAYLLSVLLSTILFPASAVYNSYVSHNMNADLPAAVSGPHTPLSKSVQPVILQAGYEKAVLMVHGFSGRPRDLGNLPKLFHEQGYDVVVPLLPAHGRGARAMEQASAKAWLKYVSRTYLEMRAQYKEVIVIGLSMGASLSLLAAASNAELPPDKLILLSPFFKVKQEWYYGLSVETYHDVLSQYIPYFQSLPGISAVCKDHPKGIKTKSRQYASTRATNEAFKIARAARKYAYTLGRLNVPVLVIQSKNDQITDYNTTRRLVEQLNTPDVQLVTLTRANHILPRDCDAEYIEETILNFALAS